MSEEMEKELQVGCVCFLEPRALTLETWIVDSLSASQRSFIPYAHRSRCPNIEETRQPGGTLERVGCSLSDVGRRKPCGVVRRWTAVSGLFGSFPWSSNL